MAESRIADFENFNKIYNYEDRQYFMNKLLEMGYNKEDVLSVLLNKAIFNTSASFA